MVSLARDERRNFLVSTMQEAKRSFFHPWISNSPRSRARARRLAQKPSRIESSNCLILRACTSCFSLPKMMLFLGNGFMQT